MKNQTKSDVIDQSKFDVIDRSKFDVVDQSKFDVMHQSKFESASAPPPIVHLDQKNMFCARWVQRIQEERLRTPQNVKTRNTTKSTFLHFFIREGPYEKMQK